MSNESPRVLIVGAGDVGLTLATVLVGADLPVTTLNRSGRSSSGAASVVADLGNADNLTGLEQAEIVVFTTAPPTHDLAGYRLAYVDGPQAILDALPSSPSRAVLVSTTGVYGADDGRWITASTPPDATRATAEVVLEGEGALAGRVPTTVVRSTGIYGPGRTRFLDRVRGQEVPLSRGPGEHWTNRIHRDDLVAALALCAVHPSPPTLAIAVDDAPAQQSRVVAWLSEQIGITAPTADVASPTSTGKRCRNSELRDLGWAPSYPSFREGYATLLADRGPVA